MAVYAVGMVRDEADIITSTLRHMASEVDELIVADNRSTDGTRDILDQLSTELPLTVIDDPEVGYFQSRKMSRLAAMAGEQGAEWVVPFDADEIWYGRDFPIRTVLAGLPCSVVTAAMYNHLATALDVDDPDPVRALVWRLAQPGAMPKVAFRWQPGAIIHQGNHGVTLPTPAGDALPALEIRHFPARSAAHFVRKAINGAEAYAATNLPESAGAHWRAYGEHYERGGKQALADIFHAHWWYLSPTDSGLVRDPAPYLRWA